MIRVYDAVPTPAKESYTPTRSYKATPVLKYDSAVLLKHGKAKTVQWINVYHKGYMCSAPVVNGFMPELVGLPYSEDGKIKMNFEYELKIPYEKFASSHKAKGYVVYQEDNNANKKVFMLAKKSE